MEHREYVRMVPGADTAVLFIHGIVGTPNHFRDSIPLVHLVPPDWSVYNILLDGHGKNMEDFAHSSMKKWKAQVWHTFDLLSQSHKNVVLVGHSMGTLFSIQLALEHPEKILYLFLLAVPMRPCMRMFGIVNMMRLVFGKIREDRPMEAATRMVCGVKTTRKLWKYARWIPRFLELFAEIHLTEQKMNHLQVPCVVYQSRKDELVSNLTRRVLEKSGVVEIRDLEKSSHFYYHPEDQKIVQKDFTNRIELLKKHD